MLPAHVGMEMKSSGLVISSVNQGSIFALMLLSTVFIIDYIDLIIIEP